MFTFEIDSENALLGSTLGTLGLTVELVEEKGNFVHGVARDCGKFPLTFQNKMPGWQPEA